MRKFGLYRLQDPTGISGTGRVADGVEFTSGKVVLHWLTDVSSIGVYDTLAMVVKIHGHNGLTKVVWDEPELSVFETLDEAWRWIESLDNRWNAEIHRRAPQHTVSPTLYDPYKFTIVDIITGTYVVNISGGNLLEVLSQAAQTVAEKVAPENRRG